MLDGEPAYASKAGDRGAFTVVEIERTFVATQPGDLVIPAPVVRYAWATKFREDFIGAAALLRIARFMIDPRDDRGVERYFQVVGTDEGIFGCMGLMGCEDLCPKEIPLQRQLAYVRRTLVAAALKGKVR